MAVISSVLSVLACILSALAMKFAVRAARDAAASLRAPPHLSESRLKSLETSVAEQADALLEVANRVKMQRVRNAANHATGQPSTMPDPYRDPDGWRKAMNSRLRTVP